MIKVITIVYVDEGNGKYSDVQYISPLVSLAEAQQIIQGLILHQVKKEAVEEVMTQDKPSD